jgi:putative phosphonate metabolism protein
MQPGARYAIYFVPRRETDLYQFGASVIGYDCYDGADVPFAEGLDAAPWARVVASPRLYGFHATLKAPFYLTAGYSEQDLSRALLAFGSRQTAVDAGSLVVREIGSFIALIPQDECKPLKSLAQRCVEEFDGFRAPLSQHDRERRVANGLTDAQMKNLERWGYPYVLSDFRFHMTLTGSLDEPQRHSVLSSLRHKFEVAVETPTLNIDQLVVARQAERSLPFQVLETVLLAAST